jgi:hypothetical protein
MNPPIHSVGTRKLAVAFCALISGACSSTSTVPQGDPLIPTPFVERRIEVTLPPELETNSEKNHSLREEYNNKGRLAIGHVRARCVMKEPNGRECPRMVDVRITAVEGAKFIDPKNPPKNPQLLAWVENFGDATTDDGFQRSTDYVYALVVGPPSAIDPERKPIIYRVGFSTDRARSTITRDVYGYVYRCHTYKEHLVSEADFQPCRGRSIYAHDTGTPLRSALVTALSIWSYFSSAGDPTWFSCSSGCCTSKPPQQTE